MSGFDVAASALREGHGGLKVLSLDNIKRAAPQSHRWSFVGATGSGNDQAAFYNLLTDTAESGATLTAATAPTGWTPATMARYIADNPAPLTNMHFTGATSNSLLEGGVVKFLRNTPDLSIQQETIFLSTFTHDMRYQPTVLSIGINGEVLDGYTFVRVLTAQNASTAQGYVLTFSFGSANDKRADVEPARPKVVAGPG